jgi:hypothetical protein
MMDMSNTERAHALAVLDQMQPSRPLLIDFDHTLLGANSTEAFLAEARPRMLAAIALTLIDALSPWKLLPARRDNLRAWRDLLRIRIVSLVDPGLWRRWRRDGARRTAQLLDRDLQALALRQDAHVVTLGFEPIVAPILDETGLEKRLIAMPLAQGWRARDAGKLERCRERLDPAVLAGAVVVTDDPEADDDVIAAAAAHVEWPRAGDGAAALSDIYLPMRYGSQVKRPGIGHVRRIILGEDAAVLCIATMFAAANGWEAVVVAILATLALASVYDIGYAENDRLGRQREAKPDTPAGWNRWDKREVAFGSWVGAAAFATPAVAILAATGAPFLLTAGALFGLLMLVRLVFGIFNRTPVGLRIAPYLVLQVLKSFGLALALGLAVTPAGAALLASVIVGRSIPYAIYRAGGGRWTTPDQIIRLGLFAAFLALAVAVAGPAALDLSAALGAVWCVLKARPELVAAAAGSGLQAAPRRQPPCGTPSRETHGPAPR